MTPKFVSWPASVGLSLEGLQAHWCDLNARYFAGRLPPISIVWSRRLTSSVGMFTSRSGPRIAQLAPTGRRREIRLSLPLLERLTERTPFAERELLNTLAHEMIHQWQFDVRKQRPDHGLDFLRKMTEMNRTGEVAITIYHSLQKEVLALSRFAWRCKDCGRVYRRQRKTIAPARHHCGACSGPLQELTPLTRSVSNPDFLPKAGRSERPNRPLRPNVGGKPFHQLTLPL